jgi:Fur family transcriptional regulator, ferric uptake regulator
MLQNGNQDCDMSAESDQLFDKILKGAGYSLTAARKLVFELLESDEPQSMHQLLERTGGRIDRASLYRVIRLFEELGIVQRVNIGWKYKLELTDIFNDHHHHISCMHCGKIIAIKENEQIEALIHAFSEKYKISAEKHQLEIQGYCENCRAMSSSKQ